MPQAEARPKKGDFSRYDPALGDDDLFVGDLSGRVLRMAIVGGVLLALVLGLGLGIAITGYLGDNESGSGQAQTENIDVTASVPPGGTSMESSTGTPRPALLPTNTPRAPVLTSTWTPFPEPLNLPTITPVPPTPTITPTPEPCYQTAWSGATIFEMALRCGHESWDVVDIILEINDMENASELREGQTLEIPWPTPTPGGVETGASSSTIEVTSGRPTDSMAADIPVNEFGTPDRLAQYQNVEPTLRPGQAWHTVALGETIVQIAYIYDTSVETLSQINPEIPFLQCDYGETYGGPNCSVMLVEGQRLRVPVPVPTPTPTATPGTRTPTPSATPTYNAPYLIAPPENAHFNVDQIVTLRWGGTGTLADNERYVVHVQDLDTGKDFTALVIDTVYILPGGWQPADRKRHMMEWTITIGTIDTEFNILGEVDQTDPRHFTWDSR